MIYKQALYDMLKKTDSNQLESSISVVILFIVIGLPIAQLFQKYSGIDMGHVALGEMVLVLGLGILLLFDVMYFFQKENREFSILELFLVLFVISIVLSTLFAQDVSLALSGNNATYEGFFVMVSYVVIMLSCSFLNEKKVTRVYIGIVIVGLIELCLGIVQSLVSSDVYINGVLFELNENGRAFGTILNPNPYGSIMLLLAGMELGIVCQSVEKNKLLLHGVLFCGFSYGVILSGTRGAWLGLIIVMVIGSIYKIITRRKEKTEKKKKTVFFVAGGVLFVLVAVALINSNAVSDAINRSINDIENGQFGENRLKIWKNSIDTCFVDNPVLGTGVSNLNIFVVSDGLVTNEEGGLDLVYYTAYDAHSRYLNILCNQGIVGLTTYLLLIGYVLIVGIKKVKNQKIPMEGSCFPFLLAIIGYLFADLFTINNIYMVPYAFIIMGLLVSRQSEKSIKKDAQ